MLVGHFYIFCEEMSSPLPSMLFSKDEIRVERIAFRFCKIVEDENYSSHLRQVRKGRKPKNQSQQQSWSLEE